MPTNLSRRNVVCGLATAAISGFPFANASAQQSENNARDPFTYCLNFSTIRGQNLGIVEEIAIAARAGYQGIEPWINELQQYVTQGGSLRDLRRRIQDAGLRVESAIGFSEWLVNDDDRRRRGLENARRDMDLVQQIGGTRIAAPPAGATNTPVVPLPVAAERYRTLLEIGRNMNVIPQIEVWGFSRNLSRLSEVAYVAIDSGHASACILADVYHLHKGGSPFGGMSLLSGAKMHVFHMNDYPAEPAREQITDAHRVYPGDGVAPIRDLIRDLHRSGFRGALSLELFNRDYWRQDALSVARTGREKMRAVVREALRD